MQPEISSRVVFFASASELTTELSRQMAQANLSGADLSETHLAGADPKQATVRIRRPNFLTALQKLDYSESAGLAVLEGMEV